MPDIAADSRSESLLSAAGWRALRRRARPRKVVPPAGPGGPSRWSGHDRGSVTSRSASAHRATHRRSVLPCAPHRGARVGTDTREEARARAALARPLLAGDRGATTACAAAGADAAAERSARRRGPPGATHGVSATPRSTATSRSHPRPARIASAPGDHTCAAARGCSRAAWCPAPPDRRSPGTYLRGCPSAAQTRRR